MRNQWSCIEEVTDLSQMDVTCTMFMQSNISANLKLSDATVAV